MAIQVIAEFISKATVRVIAYVYDDAGEPVDPTTSIKTKIWSPDGVQKSGYISVVASASFTAGLVVTGATSGAKGIVVSKPDATTLELRQVTGVWQSGEVITDTGAGTSTTTSALLGADMTHQKDSEGADITGVYEYYYRTTADSIKGKWRGEVEVIDGELENAKISMDIFGFGIK